MSKATNYISQRLSLRKPQSESLILLEKIVNCIGLGSDEESASKLEKLKALKIESFSQFERDFPSFAFALATGVGKTRLMGAFISYLFLEKNLKDFLILAPNLTIYNKLIEDFSNPSNPKYVFRGIGEFSHSAPKIITGDNYSSVNTVRKVHQSKVQQNFFGEEVFINIFNISKINSETRGNKVPKIKKMNEFFGESYFEYLKNIDQLVILMDEAHRYRAARGVTVINELKPVLGLELTATPKVKKGSKFTPFENVVFDYSLARAIADGFVKEPAVATRSNLDQKKLKKSKPQELDRMKLEDAVRVHENTKVQLINYAKSEKLPLVKPFMLVVAQDTEHAGEIAEYIKSPLFFEGRFASKVLTIHSNQKGEEKDENIEQLLSLENPDNPIEIVIHVNMLKEGWDVTNLYTIVPLRAFTADILAEQTLGRGLRLPYGKKTGNEDIDRLTVIAHDRFDELVQAAQEETSIIIKQTIIDIEDPKYSGLQKPVSVPSLAEEKHNQFEADIDSISDPKEKKEMELKARARKAVLDELSGRKDGGLKINPSNLNDKKVQDKVQKIVDDLDELSNESTSQKKETAKHIIEQFLPEIIDSSIAIPRIVVRPKEGAIDAGFKDFSLDTSMLPRFQPIKDEILIKNLQDQADNKIEVQSTQKLHDNLENILVSCLIEYDEIDYEADQELLFSLSEDMINYIKSLHSNDDDVVNIVSHQKKKLAECIWSQMQEKFFCQVGEYEVPEIKPFTMIEPHHYSKVEGVEPKDIKVTIETSAELRKTLFTGFKKACHSAYKFDTFGEKKMAQILEAQSNSEVEKWLRPSSQQFHIYWDKQTKSYEPDFVVETDQSIFMIEIKAEGQMASKDVQEKSLAAETYCQQASNYNRENSGKPWSYILIPDEEVSLNKSFKHLVDTYKVG